MIKTFRGLIASGTQDKINLHTNNGGIGYQIKKLQSIGPEPGTDNIESVLKIYSTPQTLPTTGTVDFSDQTLLAVCYYRENANNAYSDHVIVVFDNRIINQDIYVTNYDANNQDEPINYYFELEQVKLDLNENTVATLQSIRSA